mgnify:CR=1 FL=1
MCGGEGFPKRCSLIVLAVLFSSVQVGGASLLLIAAVIFDQCSLSKANATTSAPTPAPRLSRHFLLNPTLTSHSLFAVSLFFFFHLITNFLLPLLLRRRLPKPVGPA